MRAMASQISGVSIVCSTVCSVADQRKHQSSASLAFMRGIHRWPVVSPYKGPITQKIFHLVTPLWFGSVSRQQTPQGQSIATWWRHQIETFSALLGICAGNLPVTGEFPAQRPVMRSFEVFFDLCVNKRLSKQSWGWWFEMPSRSLRRHCNERLKLPCRVC